MPEVAASDFAFVFKGTGHRLIVLWTRQSQLAATGKFKTMLHLPNVPMPTKQWGGDTVEELRKEPLRLVSWRQVYHLALRYGLVELQKLCASNL
ncbi:hypothetical protein BG005_000613 [Podila minutissima]|nr:hypothetical protein BG005_000613 [Podila minutissima]